MGELKGIGARLESPRRLTLNDRNDFPADNTSVPQIAQEINHKEGTAFRLGVNEDWKFRREAMREIRGPGIFQYLRGSEIRAESHGRGHAPRDPV